MRRLPLVCLGLAWLAVGAVRSGAQAGGCPRGAAAAAGRVRICGVVRDDRERPVPDAEVVDALDDLLTRTDSTGAFRLDVPSTTRAVLLSVRRLGFAPVYRTVPAGIDDVLWNPVLKSVQRLAAAQVRASAMPAGVPPRVIDELGERYAKGVGQFLLGEQLWQTSDLGAALGRVPGIEVYAGRAGTISRLAALRCNRDTGRSFDGGRIGVFVNGTDQTSRYGLIGGLGGGTSDDQRAMSVEEAVNRRAAPRQVFVSAEEVLSEFRVGELSAVEVYRGRGEIPGVFANPDYCAVISLWTR
jgi:hypothetical protein